MVLKLSSIGQHLHVTEFSCLWFSSQKIQKDHLIFIIEIPIPAKVIPLGWCQTIYDRMGHVEWLACWPPLWVAKLSLRSRGHGFETMLQPMKQLIYNWYLPCSMKTCSHVPSMQNKYQYWNRALQHTTCTLGSYNSPVRGAREPGGSEISCTILSGMLLQCSWPTARYIDIILIIEIAIPCIVIQFDWWQSIYI